MAPPAASDHSSASEDSWAAVVLQEALAFVEVLELDQEIVEVDQSPCLEEDLDKENLADLDGVVVGHD